jgi:HK97 family phage portal protein
MGLLSRIFSKKTTGDQLSAPRRGFSWNKGFPVNEESAMGVSAYNRGVIYISSQVAKLPWAVKDADNNILQNDRVTYLLDVAPNTEMSAMDFRMLAIQSAINKGNFFAEIERSGDGRPVALWPLHSDRVQVLRTPSGNLVYQVADMGGTVYLNPRDVFHIKNFHTKDGIVGQGVIGYALEILGISSGADQLANSLFNNAGIPSGVIKVTGTLNDEGFNKIRDSWQQAHGGRKTGGVAVLEDGASYESVTIDPQVMQFLESRKFNVIEIARFLGVPPTKLFDVQAATYNNVENANLEVVTDTLDAWAKQFESQADIKLLNNRYGGKKAELDLYAVSRGDMETRANYFNKMIGMGSIQPNEIRRKEGYAPYDGGDKFYIASNNLSPVDRIDDIIDSQVEKSKPQPAANPNSVTVDNPANKTLEAEIKLLTALTEKLKQE